ncbi:hypothetical protein BD769DRAFT_1390593 [Suillus cothurnatus]|nr:hypothetical protein BD769DRAFT_1390593 [Suillus cothurnatus]
MAHAMTIDHAISGYDLGSNPGFVAIASFTVLCWDHIITFADEVALIWCKPKGLVGYLFLLNRYITPLGFVVNIVGRSWLKYIVSVDPPHLVYGEYSATDNAVTVSYFKGMVVKPAATIPGLLFLAWIVLEAYAMARGEMVSIVQQIHSCHDVHDLPLTLSAARAWIPLTYDSALFVMTLWRTLPLIQTKGAGLKLLYDATFYYTVICSANLILTVMIVRAPRGQKGVAAQLTVAMTSRVTLNLKKQIYSTSSDPHRYHSMHSPTLPKSAALLVPWQTPNLQLQSQCLTVVPCNPMPFVSMDADLMDDAQSLDDSLPNRTDLESQ